MIGERVKALRKARHWTQGQLLIQVHRHLPDGKLARETLSRIENGQSSVEMWIVVALAEALATSVDYLMGRSDDATTPVASAIPVPTAEIVPLVERLNHLPGAQRSKLAGAFMAIIDAAGDEELLPRPERTRRWLRYLDNLTDEEYQLYRDGFQERAARASAAAKTTRAPDPPAADPRTAAL